PVSKKIESPYLIAGRYRALWLVGFRYSCISLKPASFPPGITNSLGTAFVTRTSLLAERARYSGVIISRTCGGGVTTAKRIEVISETVALIQQVLGSSKYPDV